MSVTRKKHLYAISMKGGWVEIRSALTPPKPEKTEFTKKLPDKNVAVFNYDLGGYSTRKIPQMLRISNTVFVGGKVLRVLSRSRFRTIVPRTPLYTDQMIRLNDAQTKALNILLEAS